MLDGLIGLIGVIVAAIAFLLFEFGGLAVVWLIGALVGVLYPAKSPGWAQWQRVGMLFGGAALAAFAVSALMASFFDDSSLVFPCAAIGIVALIGYTVIGNVCRSYHEGERLEKPSSHDDHAPPQ